MSKTQEALKLALEAMRFALHVGFDESSESQIKKGDKAVQQHQNAIAAIREALAEQPAQQEPVTRPDCWVCVKDGKIIGFYDRPFMLAGIEAVRYVHHEEVESLVIENTRLQNWARVLNGWNDSLKERLSYREAYPANFTRDWVGLTDEDTRKINQEVWGYVSADHTRMWNYARAIEAKLREKNA